MRPLGFSPVLTAAGPTAAALLLILAAGGRTRRDGSASRTRHLWRRLNRRCGETSPP